MDVYLGDEEEMIKDIELYKEAVTISVANLAVEKKMFNAASLIFKLMNNHVDAVSCLLGNEMADEAIKYAKDAKDANAWRLICKYYLMTDLQKAFDALKSTEQLLLSTDLAHELSKTTNYEMYYVLAQYMVSKRKEKQDKFIDSDLAMLFASCIHFNIN